MDIDGRNAIITGGTKGIGRAIAEALVRAGVNVCVGARNKSEVEKTIAELTFDGEEHLGVGCIAGNACDVRDLKQVKALIEYTVKELGGVDILINNAGIGIFESVEEMSPEDFRAVLETNVFGVFYCCHEAIPLMKQRGGGYIINILSLGGANAHPMMAPS